LVLEEDIMEVAAVILATLVIRVPTPTIYTADGAGIRLMVIAGVRGADMRLAVKPGPRAAVGELAGDEERPQDTSEAVSTVGASHIVGDPHTAAASTAAAIIVDGCVTGAR
jgi:hypothetical protein